MRGLFGDIFGGLVAGGDTVDTVASAESTTMATLYGDLVVRSFGFYLSRKIGNFLHLNTHHIFLTQHNSFQIETIVDICVYL